MYSEIAKNPVEIQQIYSSKRRDIQQIYSRGSAPGGIGGTMKMCAEKMPRADTGRRRQRVPGSGRGGGGDVRRGMAAQRREELDGGGNVRRGTAAGRWGRLDGGGDARRR